MAVTSITATTSAARLCNYVLSGEAHDGSGDRRYVFASGIGCFAPIAAQAFAITRTVRSQQSVIRQAYSIVQSFGRDEFDMDDTASGERVHELGLELARRTFPGHQVLVVTQRDGKSGLLHNHIVVSNISDRDAALVYRRVPRNSFGDKLALLKQNSPDGLIEVREERPAGRAFSSAMGNRHRLAHVNDELLADMEFMQGQGLQAYNNKALMTAPPERVTKDDRLKREQGEYVWRDDLKLVIGEEQALAVSVGDFRDRLAARRVELRERGKEKHFSYGFIDAEGKARQARALGVHGLGAAFGRDATVAKLDLNQIALGQTVPQPLSVTPMPVVAPQQDTVPSKVVSEPIVFRATPADAPATLSTASFHSEAAAAHPREVLDDAVGLSFPSNALEQPALASSHRETPPLPHAQPVKSTPVVMSPRQKLAFARIANQMRMDAQEDRSL
ncbi:relaxase/mobilization nuclease domain-containing protein [Arthrobacter sp. GMC3]|uniref:relaxase/mobilization nuclease domain-containing protein n=1 Tax=Arthrobacter sp. GMC3 TaxID=2058894 RepID=UPI0015E29406|nr:relaxase/mobilization nuclease domain-containing protein [Arthrobacter sp. GMC3]